MTPTRLSARLRTITADARVAMGEMFAYADTLAAERVNGDGDDLLSVLLLWAERWYDMLEIGRRRCEPADRCGVKEAAPHNKHAKGSNTASNLEPAASDVLVWEAI